MISIADQLLAMNSPRPAPEYFTDKRKDHGKPRQSDIDTASKMLSAERITAAQLQLRLSKSLSTAQHILRILVKEGIARRVENGFAGEKGYVKA